MSVRSILMAAAGAQPSSIVADRFSAYPYSGTGAAQSLSPGVDLSTYGGLFWSKGRTGGGHRLFDSVRGSNLLDASTAGSQVSNTGVSLTTSGVNLTSNILVNNSGSTYIGWMFRKAAKFFDVVTWTGNGANRTIPHSLGQEVGMMLVKRTDTPSDGPSAWQVYHRSLGNLEYMVLNSTAAKATDAAHWNSTKATTSNISLGTNVTVNNSGGAYVAYLFAHDAGADGIVQCGAMTTNASGAATVALGWSPQFVVYKATSTTSNWTMLDTARGWVDSAGNDDMQLFANTTTAEAGAQRGNPTSGGFSVVNESASSSYVYMAIRAA